MALALGSALRIAGLKGNFLKIEVFGIRNQLEPPVQSAGVSGEGLSQTQTGGGVNSETRMGTRCGNAVVSCY